MSTSPSLVVIGSANQDLVVRVAHVPAPGETILGGDFMALPGGKGANQAVAAARLGARVRFVGRVGADAFGDALVAGMTDAAIDPVHVRRDRTHPTGVALIGVGDDGQNAIIVAPGANGQVDASDIDDARESIAAAAAIVVQLEIPRETVAYALRVARSCGTRVILNPAPADHRSPLSEALLRDVAVLTPNEHEAANLLGLASPAGLDMAEAAVRLRTLGPEIVIVTLGGEGCLIASPDGVERLPAIRVTPVDTTAAGDCFTGALAVALGEGRSVAEAARFAIKAASLSVTRMGAQPSLPSRAEVDAI
jgi:ribokinase